MKRQLFVLALALLAISGLSGYYFGQNKVNSRPVDWSVIETMHFDVHYPKGNDDFGRMVALMAEDTYYYLKDGLQFPIGSRIPLVVYGSRAEFQATNIIYPVLSEGVGGFTESLKNRVALPFEGSYTKLEQVLTHELVHAYSNALEKGLPNAFSYLKQSYLPFWFSEGLPEFFAIGGEDNYNNMFVLDMVVNDNLGKLNYTDGYYAYRLGESFLTYIGETYGRDKVIDYFYAIKAMGTLDEATKKVFGMEFDDLESRWRYHLKRSYFPLVSTHKIPKEEYEQRTFNKVDGSYLNLAPRFSPDGRRYVYFSNRGARFSIWLSGLHGLSPAKRILVGETTSKHEEFYFFRSSLAWFPDNKTIAFVSKTPRDDTIYFFDVDTAKITGTVVLPEVESIYEIDVSADGKYMALSAQSNMQTDIYLYDIETQELRKLTDDRYHDAQPRFSPDGSKIAFSSERVRREENIRKGFFSDLFSAIFSIDLDTGTLFQHTFDDFNCSFPTWDGSGERLNFVSEQDKISNVETIDLISGTRSRVTNVLSGINAVDFSTDNEYVLLSAYFDGAFNIYFGNNPFSGLEETAHQAEEALDYQEDLFARIDISRLDYFGRRKPRKIQRQNPRRFNDGNHPFFRTFEYAPEDSLQLFRDYSWDDKPDSVGVVPEPRPYRTRFSLDTLWGGAAYSSAFGTIAQLELGFSDLMGNHAIGLDLSTNGDIEDSNFFLRYLYLKQRSDYGIGVYNLYDETIYRFIKPGPDDYYRQRQREQGLYLLYRYPFSKFFRTDLDMRLYRWEYYLDSWQWNQFYTAGRWIEDDNPYEEMVVAPGITLVHDTALYGSTGPLIGMRSMYMLRKSFTSGDKSDFLTAYIDYRTYSLFSRRYSFATRLVGGLSTGNNPQRFNLGGYHGVRAYDGELSGEKKVMGSLELRYPFLDYIAMAFPIPLTIGGVRGSAFIDVGAVWDDNKTFRGIRDGRFEDIHMGYGFGPRINLGFIVLRFDVAWQTDLSVVSKPAYYISLTEDF